MTSSFLWPVSAFILVSSPEGVVTSLSAGRLHKAEFEVSIADEFQLVLFKVQNINADIWSQCFFCGARTLCKGFIWTWPIWYILLCGVGGIITIIILITAILVCFGEYAHDSSVNEQILFQTSDMKLKLDCQIKTQQGTPIRLFSWASGSARERGFLLF